VFTAILADSFLLFVFVALYLVERHRGRWPTILVSDLRKSEQTLRSMVEQSLDAIIVVDGKSKVTYWKRAATKRHTPMANIGRRVHTFRLKRSGLLQRMALSHPVRLDRTGKSLEAAVEYLPRPRQWPSVKTGGIADVSHRRCKSFRFVRFFSMRSSLSCVWVLNSEYLSDCESVKRRIAIPMDGRLHLGGALGSRTAALRAVKMGHFARQTERRLFERSLHTRYGPVYESHAIVAKTVRIAFLYQDLKKRYPFRS
jgi:hypothetical protein